MNISKRNDAIMKIIGGGRYEDGGIEISNPLHGPEVFVRVVGSTTLLAYSAMEADRLSSITEFVDDYIDCD